MTIKPLTTQIAASVLAASLLSSCASIVSGTRQEVRVNSTPSGAIIRVDDAISGQTPTTLTLSSRHAHTLRIELAGYKPYEAQLHQKLNGWVFGNLFFGGVIGIVVDSADGAIFALKPNQIDAQLVAEERASHERRGRRAANDHGRVIVKLVSKPDPTWQRIGQLEKQ